MGECILVQDGAEFPYFHTVSNFELTGFLDRDAFHKDQMQMFRITVEMKLAMKLQTAHHLKAFQKLNDLIEKQATSFSDSMAFLKMLSKSRICLKYLLLNRPKTWIY